MKLQSLIAALEEIAPTRLAESWDNVGLLAGDPEQSISRAMLTIDYTPAVADETRSEKCDCVIAYHPPIFETLKRVTSHSLIFDAIRRGVAIYSPHTALDAAPGGTNDILADTMALIDRAPLKTAQSTAKQLKLVTFVPTSAVDKVSEALFAAGAGRIGNYSSCSFRTPGTGTFFGEPGANPTVGQPGKLERAEEIRLETLIPINRIDEIIRALKQSHPYEEPAFDLIQLAAPPETMGVGRIGKLPGDATADMLINRIKRELEIDHLLVAGDITRLIKRAAVCAGAGGSLLDEAIAKKADLYLTGEMRHHDVLKAVKSGMVVVLTLHSNSERATLKKLRDVLRQKLPPLEVLLSREDRDPLSVR
jgi:dinuclear metal center YbgI/SA1388 family protein